MIKPPVILSSDGKKWKVSAIREEDLAGFTTVEPNLAGVTSRTVCRRLNAAFMANIHKASTLPDGHWNSHFNGRMLWADKLDPQSAATVRRLSLQLGADIRRMFGEKRRLKDDMPHFSRWYAPHGMSWHQDTRTDQPIEAQRQYTALLYIHASPDLKGGETAMRDQRLLVRPVIGSALLFRAAEWHGVSTVAQGERAAIMFWYIYASGAGK